MTLSEQYFTILVAAKQKNQIFDKNDKDKRNSFIIFVWVSWFKDEMEQEQQAEDTGPPPNKDEK